MNAKLKCKRMKNEFLGMKAKFCERLYEKIKFCTMSVELS